jgi:hypothetical protein
MAGRLALCAGGTKPWLLGLDLRLCDWDLTTLRQELARLRLNLRE